MNVPTVAEGFDTYRKQVIPDSAPRVQTEECRRAFYAGAYYMLMNAFISVADQSGDDTDEDSMAALEALKAEIETYVGSLQPGYSGASAVVPDTPPSSLILAPDIAYTTPDPDAVKPILQALGRLIGEAVPPGYGFVLLLFSLGAGGNTFYISDSDRADVITLLREFLRKQIS